MSSIKCAFHRGIDQSIAFLCFLLSNALILQPEPVHSDHCRNCGVTTSRQLSTFNNQQRRNTLPYFQVRRSEEAYSVVMPFVKSFLVAILQWGAVNRTIYLRFLALPVRDPVLMYVSA